MTGTCSVSTPTPAGSSAVGPHQRMRPPAITTVPSSITLWPGRPVTSRSRSPRAVSPDSGDARSARIGLGHRTVLVSFSFAAHGAQVPAPDYEAEHHVVHRGVAQADRHQQERILRDAEVEQVVDGS